MRTFIEYLIVVLIIILSTVSCVSLEKERQDFMHRCISSFMDTGTPIQVRDYCDAEYFRYNKGRYY